MKPVYYLFLFLFPCLGGIVGLMCVWRIADIDAQTDWHAGGLKGIPPDVRMPVSWEFFIFGLLGLIAAYFLFRWLVRT